MALASIMRYLSFLTKPYSPLFANIDITMRCNSKCSYCLRWAPDYKLGAFDKTKYSELSTEQACAVIDNISKFPVINLTIQGAEPLLRPDLPDILKHAKKRKLNTQIITNAILLEKRAEEIAPYLNSVLISYDTPIRTDYKKLRGVDTLRKVEAGIKRIVELSKIHKFLVITNSVLTTINSKYIPQLVKHCFEELKVHGMAFDEVLVPKHPSVTWSKLKIKSKAVLNRVVSELKNLKEKYPILSSDYYLSFLGKRFNYLCKPWLFLAVNADGSCTPPCPAFPKKKLDFTEKDAYKKWPTQKDFWSLKCNECTMPCILEISKLFPVPNPVMLFDWLSNLKKARARMSAL